MIMNREVLLNTKQNVDSLENLDMFEYTLEVASVMNDDISSFMEAVTGNIGNKKFSIGFDFGKIVSSILDALWSALKKLFRTFLSFLAQLASMGSSFEIELRQFKERIKAFNGNVTLDFPYYEYTNLSDEYPNFKVYQSIEDIIEYYKAEYDKRINQGGTAVYLMTELDNKIDAAAEQNKFRNMLLYQDKTYGHDCSDYARLLSEWFRAQNSTPRNDVVLPGNRIYNDFYIPYVDSRKEIKKIQKEESNVDKNIKQIKSKIQRNYFDLTKINQFATEDQDKLMQSVGSIQRKLLTSVDLMCQDLLLMYGQKLQAYKEFKTQSRKVLVLTIKAIIMQGG